MGVQTMLFTAKMAKQVRKACRGTIRVGFFYWEGSEDEGDNAGFNNLLADQDTRDLADQVTPEEMIGIDVPDRDGYVSLDVYLYDRHDGLTGNRQVILSSRGDVIWSSERGGDKVGRMVARHFGEA